MRIRANARLIATLALLMAATAAFAMGGREDPLVQADRLIDENKYDEAILYLADFMKAYPERFDEGQKRLRRIAELRRQFNALGEQLLVELGKPSPDQATILGLIAKIEDIGGDPSPFITSFIGQTKDAALFAYNRSKFEEIMARGSALIAEGRYAAAARAYQEGFVLYRPEFLATGIDQVSADAALSTVDGIDASLAAFETEGAELAAAFRRLAAAYEALPAQGAAGEQAADSAWAGALAAAPRFLAIRDGASRAGRSLESFFAAFSQRNENATDNSFLPFAYRLILGRASAANPEGVVGAMDAQWRDALDGARTALERALETSRVAGQEAYDGGRWSEAIASFTRAADLADRGQALLALWGYYAPGELERRATPYGKALLASEGTAWLRLGHAAGSARSWAALAGLQAGLDAVEGRLTAFDADAVDRDAALAAYASIRANFAQGLRDIETVRAESGARAESLSRQTVAGFAAPDSADLQGQLDGRIGAAIGRAQGLETRAVAGTAAYEYAALEAAAAEAARLAGQGKIWLDGLPSDDPAFPDATFYYPGKALTTFASADAALKALTRQISAFVSTYRAGPAYLASSASVSDWVTRATALGSAAAADTAQVAELTAAARQLKQQADSARLEADRRMTEASAALKKADFAGAREKLDRARERYLLSLSLEQDAALRADVDRKLNELAASIIKAQNDLVVLRTRQLLTQSKDLYLRGLFEQAESTLLEARATWSATNASPESEVEYWLKLVQTALTVKSGRDIPVTAPLYPEMSQLLSLAKEYYEQGAALMAKRDIPGALQRFALAKQKIGEIQVVFPLNQEARVLRLRIEQLEDKDQFNRSFAADFEKARAQVASGEDLAGAYSTLKDLESINPGYKGLRALIEQAEIKLGFRLPPVDPRIQAEASRYYAAALRIYDSRDTTQYAAALAQLEQALKLVPTYEQASLLKDKLSTARGGDATIVLPSAGETVYNEAFAFFSAGNYLSARASLRKLLAAYPQASRVQRVNDLDARLAALGY